MDDILKRLLDAELRAEQLAQKAEQDQERTIQEAMREARSQDERLRSRVPDLHRGYIHKAEERAEQTIAELRRRYDERQVELRKLADQHANEALDSAFALLIDPGL